MAQNRRDVTGPGSAGHAQRSTPDEEHGDFVNEPERATPPEREAPEPSADVLNELERGSA
jgi:hypothetical protein